MYVDDILITENTDDIRVAKKLFPDRFNITDLDVCPHFLDDKIEYTPNETFLWQRPYMQKIIQLAGKSTAKDAECPLPPSHFLYEPKFDLM